MPITIQLDDTKAAEKQIGLALAEEMNRILSKAANNITPKLRTIIEQAMLNSPEVQSLQGGDLQAELGVPEAASRIRNLINIVGQSIRVEFIPTKLRGGFATSSLIITAVRSDHADVLSSSDAIYHTSAGQVIEWLEWLLLAGDKVVIREYQVGLDVYGVSRTGLGKVMVKNEKASWHVPSQFSGTEDNNFITRAIDSASDEIEALIVGQL